MQKCSWPVSLQDFQTLISQKQLGSYLLKLQIDNVILVGCGQACLDMPKESLKT